MIYLLNFHEHDFPVHTWTFMRFHYKIIVVKIIVWESPILSNTKKQKNVCVIRIIYIIGELYKKASIFASMPG